MADAASRALTPSAAAKMCTKQPALMPSAAATPAFAPERSEFVTMYSTSGPGVRFSRMPAATNRSSWCRSGIARSSRLEEGTDGRDRALDSRGIDAEVRGDAQAVQARREHALRLE